MTIDFNHLQQYTAGDRHLEAEVLGLFVETARSALSTLKSTCSGEEWRMVAHKLKGSALAVGAWDLAEISRRAEMAGPTAPGVQDLLRELASHIADTTAVIAATCADSEGAAKR
ncbi:Hpt domain-containing protein [Rhodoligotrophos ferricapiens]|uniref:Hpt domain-containing protein n=1 Tax=Rhodoligotrophos ferricapiens TaxID=3069264 RepID=UPI00315C6735